MVKKFRRYFIQKFCRHDWVEIRNPETDNFIRENEKNMVSIYSYWIESQCTKCGKIKHENINTYYLR